MKRLVVLLLCLLTIGAFADTEVLQPGPTECCDSFVWQVNPDNNYNHYDHLDIGYFGGRYLSLIRFDELDDPLFDGCTVNEATLALRPIDGSGWGSPPVDCYLHQITDAWEQDTVTWNTMPGYDAGSTVDFTYTTPSTWLLIDVTNIVTSWLEYGEENQGFFFAPAGTDYFGITFHSGEYGTASQRPALQVIYTPGSAVETVSWGVVKALE